MFLNTHYRDDWLPLKDLQVRLFLSILSGMINLTNSEDVVGILVFGRNGANFI